MKAHSSAPASAAALLLLVALAGASDCGRTLPSSPSSAAAFVGRRRGHSLRSSSAGDAILARGGAAALDEYDSDLDVGADEYDSEEEEEAIRVIPKKLKKSTVRAAKKAGSKKSAASKRAIGATLYETKPKKRKASLAKVLRIPYIVRACLNPITCFVMMRAYLASLFNIDYLVEESSQSLRSALEDKAKREGGSGGRKKPKRQFKPGQAKTLSDLPQLNA